MSPKKRETVPVSERAVIARINRALKQEDEVLKIARSERVRLDLGSFYTVNFNRNYLVHKDIDLEQYARELGVLREYEHVSFDE